MIPKVIGGVLLLFSLICIISTSYDVVTAKIGLWSLEAVGAYVFHPVTAFAGLLLLARDRRPAPGGEES